MKLDNSLLKIFSYMKPYKIHVVLNVIFNVLYAMFSTISFIALIPMMQVLFDKAKKIEEEPVYKGLTKLPKYAQEYLYYYITDLTAKGGAQYALLLVITIIIISFLFKNLFDFLASQQSMYLRNGILKDLRKVMYKKIIELPVSYYSERRKGDIITRVLGDVNDMQSSFFAVLELVVKEPMTIVFSIISMFAISFKLTLFVFVFIPISGYFISKIGKTLKSKSSSAQHEGGYLISVVEESLTGLKIVKSYNAEGYFKDKFNGSVMRLFDLSNNIGKKTNLASPLSEFMGIITIAILLWYGGNLVLIDKTLEGAVFLTYMGLAYNILTPAKSISKATYTVKGGLAAAKRVFEVLEVENTIVNKPNAIHKTTFEDKLEIKNVFFKYEQENVLKDFSLEVKKGKTIALVGQSGSGKSTIANLLTRFYDIQKGEITVDGISIKDMDIHSLRGLIGLVTQDSILFNDTIKENIALSKLDATDEEIIAALKIANAYEFVSELPNGIYTNIGDAGNKLSGGQKQRLSIARAVLKNPPIMILDEATSALDTESEKFVQVALENMMQNRTSIVIAHRLSTIQKADLIVVMNKGKIVEQGKHDELIAMNGTYNKLVSLQSFE